MSRKFFIGLLVIVFALAGLSLLTGCAKKEVRTDMPAPAVKAEEKGAAGLTEAQLREQRLKEELARNGDIIWYAVRCSNFGMLHSYSTVIHTEKSPWVPFSGHDDDF